MDHKQVFDASVFAADAISQETLRFNDELIKLMTPMPEWWVVGPQAIRDARARGEGPFPAPVRSPRASQTEIPGKSGPIGLRIIRAEQPRGVYLHIHGGGWVLGQPISRIPCSSGLSPTPVFPASASIIDWPPSIRIRRGPTTAKRRHSG